MGEILKIDGKPAEIGFKDIHDIFAILRADSFIGFIQKSGSAEGAMDSLYRLNNAKPIVSAWQNPTLGVADSRAVSFLGHLPTEKGHWIGLVGMLKAAGFTNKDELRSAARINIAKMTNGVRMYNQEERDAVARVADEAIADVFGE